MKVNYEVNADNQIVGYRSVPFYESEPYIEIPTESIIHLGVSTVVDGVFYENKEAFEKAQAAIKARNAILTEISTLKRSLADTDYESLKFSEGEMTAEEFEPYKVQRHQWRLRIRELEEQLKGNN